MSTTTNFKRIALVAVAALGLGVLSSVPATAQTSGIVVTATNGTAGTAGVRTDSTNAALINVSGTMADAADSVVVRVTTKSISAGITPATYIRYADSSTPSIGSSTIVDSVASTSRAASTVAIALAGPMSATSTTRSDTAAVQISTTGGAGTNGGAGFFRVSAGGANTYVSANFWVQMDSASSTRVAGTVTYSVTVMNFDNVSGAVTETTKDFSITIAALASASLVASPTYSTAVMSVGTSDGGSTVDSSVSVAATASSTANAVILVTLRNASNVAVAQESITATTTIGTIGNGTTQGRSVTLVTTAGATTLQLRADGTAGTASITISTPSVTFTTKTAIFYATTAATGVATKRVNTLSVGSNSGAITAVFKDANGNVIGGSTSVYAFSDALTVVSETASACTYDGANARHTCSLTGVAAGKANITIGNASKSVVSAVIPVTVSSGAPVSLKMAWNKSTYAPGEKAFLSVWAVDAAGLPVGSRTISNLLAGGVSTTAGFTGTQTIPNSTTSFALAQKLADTDGLDSLEPVFLYTVYMPYSGGSVKVSATGGTSLPLAGQVEVSATASVTDNGAAALAAVTALATTVASLKTLITTLTNLVLKIQKKVKA